jgi:uncharacterized membrane protein
LVDIAQRSLSDSNADPTTAVQAIDRLHDCLRQLASRPFPSGRHHDDRGELRLIVPTLAWDGYVRLAFDEIRQAGAESPQVRRRLKAALDDLLLLAPVDRRRSLEHQLQLLVHPRRSRESTSLVSDRAGIGAGEDVLLDAATHNL